MRRNLGSELAIAIGAVAIIICGLFFALLLSNPSNPPSPTNISSSIITSVAQSNTDDVTVTSEVTVELVITDMPVSIATDTEIPSDTPELTATDTEIPSETPLPTVTDTEIPSDTPEPKATDTEIPSDTVVPTATDTEIPSETPLPTARDTEIPSETPLPTSTDTEIPSETPLPTATDTEIPSETLLPTATDTEIPSETPLPTATDTEIPSETPLPTATDTEIPSETPLPTATDTEIPSETPLPTATNTEIPSDTPTATLTLTPSDTPRPSATSTSENAFIGIIPTLPPSPTVAPLDEPTRTPASCDLPRGWTTYLVQPGDTLFAISLATNSTVDELRFANCIDDIDNIIANVPIFVPIAPLQAVSTLVPSGIRQGLAAVGCTSAMTQITSPITAQRVSGTFTVFGTATRSDFQYYKIEVRPDFAEIYNFYSNSQMQVSNGVLGRINAELFGEGLHWIRLSVVDIRAEIQHDAICEIPVIFE